MSVTANSTLTAVHAHGAVDSYDGTGTEGTLVWEGTAPGCLTRVRQTRQTDGVERKGATDRFVILSRDAPAGMTPGPDWEASTVTIRDERGPTPVERTFRVLGLDHRAAGLSVDSTRLELDRETN